MYENFFRLKEKPFSLTPDSQLIFPSKKHTAALDHLRYGILEKKGFILITGEAGSGKTTLCRSFLKSIENNIEVALILNSFLSEEELLRAINKDFGIDASGETREQLVSTLNEFLLKKKEEKKTVVVMVDESQNLNPSVLEQLRMLSNLETEKEKLIQIVLLGQPELEETLAQHDLRQLNQRITVRFHIDPLDFYETQKYIYYRLHATSEGDTTVSFTKGAFKKIYKASKGLPRNINVLCDHALLATYVRESFSVTESIVRKSMRELKWNRNVSFAFFSWQKALGSVAALALLTSSFYFVQLTLLSKEAAIQKQEIAAAPLKTIQPEKKIQPTKTEQIEQAWAELAPSEPVSDEIVYFTQLNEALWQCAQYWPAIQATTPLNSKDKRVELLLRQGLDYAETWAGLSILSKINLPCVLQVNFPESDENSYVILSRLSETKANLFVSSKKTKVVSREELEQMWHGKAFIPYMDSKGVKHSQIFIQNMRGKGVELLQKRLYSLGYLKNGVSGTYDGKTRQAVERFQKDMGFPIDGIAGIETHLALYHLSEQKGTPFLVQANPNTGTTLLSYEENND